MPPARYATAPPRRAQTQARKPRSRPGTPPTRPTRPTRPTSPTRQTTPRWVGVKEPIRRVRWDRVGRVALVLVLAVVAGLYIQHAVAYLQARSQAGAQQAIVKRLQRENAALTQRAKGLNDPKTIVRDARALGMVYENERPYSITGLPNR